VGTIFNQQDIVSIAERAKAFDVTREAKIVNGHDGSDIAADSRLQISPIGNAIPLDTVKLDLRAEVLNRFDSCRANVCGNKDLISRTDPHGTQTVKKGGASPKEIEP
jgi:hypothetical protein